MKISQRKTQKVYSQTLHNYLIFRYCTKLYSHLGKKMPDVALNEHLKSETGYEIITTCTTTCYYTGIVI